MTEAELHTLSRLLLERTALVQVGSMAVRCDRAHAPKGLSDSSTQTLTTNQLQPNRPPRAGFFVSATTERKIKWLLKAKTSTAN